MASTMAVKSDSLRVHSQRAQLLKPIGRHGEKNRRCPSGGDEVNCGSHYRMEAHGGSMPQARSSSLGAALVGVYSSELVLVGDLQFQHILSAYDPGLAAGFGPLLTGHVDRESSRTGAGTKMTQARFADDAKAIVVKGASVLLLKIARWKEGSICVEGV
ncbi:hypothetical protein VTK73DRAFT_9748 [Phialemonium thermophilum]|uniref:Uncharacterized protein n=1 Tax=Phialemonium thermophilum TaxID=223376 RepID=A0ABR3W0G3_9PEZI